MAEAAGAGRGIIYTIMAIMFLLFFAALMSRILYLFGVELGPWGFDPGIVSGILAKVILMGILALGAVLIVLLWQLIQEAKG